MTFTTPSNGFDYSKYIWGDPITKQASVNVPSLLDFSLVPWDGNFIKLGRGTYIVVDTITYSKWFTGYITNDPSLEYLGTKNGNPVWGYKFQATDDSYVLNLYPLGVMPPFTNTTQGAIIRALTQRLRPGQFDTSNVADGINIARYVVDPNKTFSDVVKEFADQSYYQFWANNKKLYFQQQDANASGVVVDGSSKHFTPSNLTLQPSLSDKIINDAVVLGDIEPQNWMTEYFVGDGYTGKMPLVSSVFGSDRNTLLSDNFGGSSIDQNNWTVVDTANDYIQVYNGYLNTLGGTNTGAFDTYLQSANLIPLEGHLRLTHGEFDFVSASDGVIGGIWTAVPGALNPLSTCLFGIRCTKSGNDTILQPLINGSVDTSQSVTTKTNCRYVFRTILTIREALRRRNIYPYATEAGRVEWLSPYQLSDVADFQTFITEINFSPEAPVLGSTAGGTLAATTYYVRTSYVTPDGETPASSESYVAAGANNLLTVASPSPQAAATGWNVYVGTAFGQETLQNASPLAISTSWTLPTGGLTTTGAVPPASALGSVTNEYVWYNTGVSIPSSTEYAYYMPVVLNDLHVTVTGITIDLPMQVDLQIKPKGSSTWSKKLVGANEIDSMDGIAPYATITTSGGGVSHKSSVLGTKNFNAGQATLEFFKNSTSQVTQVPQPGDIVLLRYRSAGAAMARVQNRTSVATEASEWGDLGIRSITKTDLKPLPRSSYEAELAAAAIVLNNGYQHYQGTYGCDSQYTSTAEPMPGRFITFQNLPSQFPSLQAEVITQVTTKLMGSSPTLNEYFKHEVTFGHADWTRQLLATFTNPTSVFMPRDTTEVPDYIDATSVGNTVLQDVWGATLNSWDANYLYFNTNQAPPSGGGFEVRYTDVGWGCDPGKNLVGRFYTQDFRVPRNVRGKLVWVRAFDTRNKILWSEDLTKWTQNATTTTNAKQTDPDGNTSTISTVSFGANANVANRTGLPAANQTFVFSVDVKGTAGTQVSLAVSDYVSQVFGNQVFTLSGNWQRFSISGSIPSGNTGTLNPYIGTANGVTLQLTRASLELGTTSETVYCKTRETAYGATSRFSAGVHVAFPMVPPSPTATADISDPLHPVLTVTLPSSTSDNSAYGIAGLNNSGPSLADVWGYEIRASDNSTVLQHVDLTDASSTLTYTYDNSSSPSRSLKFFVYTYNLLGEYSTSTYEVDITLSQPSCSTLGVDEATKSLWWTTSEPAGVGQVQYILAEIATDSGYTNIVLSKKVLATYLALSDQDFFEQRYFRVTPYDVIGAGTNTTAAHVYNPSAVAELNGNEVTTVAAPATPTTDPTVPTAMKDWESIYIGASWRNYAYNRYRDF